VCRPELYYSAVKRPQYTWGKRLDSICCQPEFGDDEITAQCIDATQILYELLYQPVLTPPAAEGAFP
jgi:hypothetical protein